MAISAKPYVIRIYPEAGKELSLLENLHGDAVTTVASHRIFLRNTANFLMAVASGEKTAALQIIPNDSAAVRASATLTFAGQPTAGESFVVGGITFTARASGAVNNEFNIGADAAATIVAAAAAVNSSTTAIVARELMATATSATVLTISAAVPGARGNMIAITEGMTNVTLGGTSGGCLSGGTDTTQDLTQVLTIA